MWPCASTGRRLGLDKLDSALRAQPPAAGQTHNGREQTQFPREATDTRRLPRCHGEVRIRYVMRIREAGGADFPGPSSEPVDFNRGFLDHPERIRSFCAACIDQIVGWSIRHWLVSIGRSCRSGDGRLIGPVPSQSEPVQSLPQLRSKLLDELSVRPTRSAFASLMRLSRVRNEARSAA